MAFSAGFGIAVPAIPLTCLYLANPRDLGNWLILVAIFSAPSFVWGLGSVIRFYLRR
jgi:hypothetical protein